MNPWSQPLFEMKHVNRLAGLRRLMIFAKITDAGLVQLRGLKKPKYLEVTFCKVTRACPV